MVGSPSPPVLYRLLVRMLPARFRDRYGREILGSATARAAEIRPQKGAQAHRAFWRGEAFDLARTLVREWTCAIRTTKRTHSPPETLRDMLQTAISEVFYTARSLARAPVFALVVVATLALGVGATSAVYSIVNGVLLRPLPYLEPDRIVLGFGSFHLNNRASVSPPDYLDYRDEVTGFRDLAAATTFTSRTDLTGDGDPVRLNARAISANLLSTLGVAPELGRSFTAEEATEGGPAVAILSAELWNQRFNAEPGILGSTIVLDDVPTIVIGVMEPGFEILGGDIDIWRPLLFGADNMIVRRFHFLRVFGRLADGVSLEAAQRETDALAERLAELYPASNTGWTMALHPVMEARFGSTRQPLLLLFGAAIAVFLIGCSNIAVLVLSRWTRRSSEVAIRTALGGSPGQVLRLVAIENVLLGLVGGAVGLTLAAQIVGVLRHLAGTGLPRIQEVSLDGTVVLVGLGFSLLTGLAFALVPARSAVRQDLNASIQQGGRSTTPRHARVFRNALVVVQLTISVALLMGAGVFLRSLSALHDVDLGFDAEPVLTASLSLPASKYPAGDAQAAFWDELTDSIRGLPGVAAVGMVTDLPLAGGFDTWVYPADQPPTEGSQGINAEIRGASDGYFQAMQIVTVAGRTFDGRDSSGGNVALVIDQTLADLLFPERSAVGQQVVLDAGDSVSAEVIGVVAGVHMYGPTNGQVPTMYVSPRQMPTGSGTLTVRSEAPTTPATLAPAVRRAVSRIDERLPVSDVRGMTTLVEQVFDAPRFRTALLGAFAGIALLLALLGLYGVMSYFVAERRREMGLRMALGAARSQVVHHVLRRGMALVAAGVLAGALLAFALGQLVASLLFNVSSNDPIVLVTVLALLVATGWAACWIPARRSASVDPVEVMRAE